MKKQIKLGAILSYVAIALSIVSGLVYTPWMIQEIGKSDYGLYTLANSIINIFLVDFGLSAATARFLSKYNAEGDREKANQFMGVVYKLYLLIDAVVLVSLIAIYFVIDTGLFKLAPEEIPRFKVVYIVASLYAVIHFPFVTQNGVLTSYEKIIQLKYADILYRVLLIGGTVLALMQGWGLYSLVCANALAGLLVIVYKYIVISTHTPLKANFRASGKGVYKSLFGFSVWTTVSSLAQRLIFGIIPSVLGIMCAESVATSEIAVFGIITTIEMYFYMVTSAINGIFMPKIARIYAGSDEESDVLPLMTRVGKFQFFLNGLLVVGFAAAGQEFISLWLEPGYGAAYWGTLCVILPGMFMNALQIANTAMIVQNKIRLRALIDLGTGLLNVALAFLLVGRYGALGGGVSIGVAYSVRAILYHIVCVKVLKINIPRFAMNCYFRFVPTFGFTFAAGLGLNLLWTSASWGYLIAKAAILTIVFVSSAYAIALTKQERASVTSIAKRLIRK